MSRNDGTSASSARGSALASRWSVRPALSREPQGPTELPKRSWWAVLRLTVRQFCRECFKQLIATINIYIANGNAGCKPFTWTADADAILAHVRWIESEVHKLTGH